MNKIKPEYVTFEQAKSLFQKGFNSKVRGRYFIADKKPFEAGKLYLSDYDLESLQIYAPEQWQVVEWLRVNHGIWVEVMLIKGYKYTFQCYNETLTEFGAERIGEENTKDFNSPQEAYSTAFDYILNNNLI